MATATQSMTTPPRQVSDRPAGEPAEARATPAPVRPARARKIPAIPSAPQGAIAEPDPPTEIQHRPRTAGRGVHADDHE